MKFPLTDKLLDEARRFELRSACCHCFYWDGARAKCRHDWPDEGQSRWPLDRPDGATEVAFCKEFELK